jgi:hypothetical protein
MWAAEEVARVRREFERIPKTDAPGWAGVARETAGVFAAWSTRPDPGSPGPLARVADVLARTAALGNRARRGPSLRPVAVITAGAAMPPGAWTAPARLLRELRHVVMAVHDAEIAQRRPTQAARILALDTDELPRIRARLENGRPFTLAADRHERDDWTDLRNDPGR